jgi:hypothetical protein
VPAPNKDKGNDCQQNEAASRGAADQRVHGRVQVGDRVIVTMAPEFPGVVKALIGINDGVAVVTVAAVPEGMVFVDLGQFGKLGRTIRGTTIRVTLDRLRHDRTPKTNKKPSQ